MKRVVIITVVCAFALIAMPVMADHTNGLGWSGGTGKWYRISGYKAGQGGEFTVYDDDTTSMTLLNSAYDSSTKGQYGGSESFQTFCLEVTERAANPMKIFVSEENKDGGGWGSGSHAWEGSEPGGDNLDSRTAYLYQQFALGELEGYIYSNSTSTRTSVTFGSYTGEFYRWETAGVLQRVIWALEDEGGYPSGGFTIETTSFYDVKFDRQDEVDLANYYYNEMDLGNWTGIGDVRVLQMSTLNGGESQDFLFMTPVPGAVVLGMLGVCVAGIKLRKFA